MMTRTTMIKLAVAILIHFSSVVGHAEGLNSYSGVHSLKPNSEANAKQTQSTFVFDFQGKGARAFWDIGAITAAYELFPRIQSGDVVYAGNSSGSAFAAYFSCWGVNRESIEFLQSTLLQYLARPELQMDSKTTLKKLLSSRLFGVKGVVLEKDHQVIGELIDQLLSKRDSHGNEISCVPTGSIMISAANLDVLDTRVYDDNDSPTVEIWAEDQTGADGIYPIPAIKKSTWDRVVDMTNFNVTKDGKDIGKACTYFVTQDLYDRLKTLDRTTRQCELRLITTLEDLKLAIHASIAEPTMFEPVVETHPENIEGGIVQPGTRRVYNGGYLVSPLGKDLKLVEPGAFVVGTGVHPFDETVDQLMKFWFAMSPNESLAIQKKSLDVEIPGTGNWNDIIRPDELVREGYKKTKEVLEPFKTERSRYSMPLKSAALNSQPLEEDNQDFDRIEKAGTPDTKPITILLRLPKEVVDRLVKQTIDEGLQSSDEQKQEEAARLKKNWLLGGAFKKKRYQAAATRLLDNLIDKAVDAKETNKSMYWNLVGAKTKTVDSVAARNIESPHRERLLDGLPEGIADAEGAFLIKIEVSKAITSYFYGPKISKQPVHIVLQILEGDPEPIPADGFYQAFINVSGGKEPKVLVDENNMMVARSLELSKTILQDGLLQNISRELQKTVDTLPPVRGEEN